LASSKALPVCSPTSSFSTFYLLIGWNGRLPKAGDQGNSSRAVVLRIVRIRLIQVQWRFAVIALHYATKDLVAALGAHVAGFLVLNPLFSAEFPSVRHGSKDDPLAYGHRKIVNVTTGKITALVTARVSLFLRAGSDVTLAAVHESVVRQAALAMNVIHGEVFAMRQRAFAGRASPVEVYEPLLELGVIVTFCNVNRTHTAIETTRRDEIRICGHSFPHSRSVGLAK
jgi:hypothetical protein